MLCVDKGKRKYLITFFKQSMQTIAIDLYMTYSLIHICKIIIHWRRKLYSNSNTEVSIYIGGENCISLQTLKSQFTLEEKTVHILRSQYT